MIKLHDVILKAMAEKLTWIQAAEIQEAAAADAAFSFDSLVAHTSGMFDGAIVHSP